MRAAGRIVALAIIRDTVTRLAQDRCLADLAALALQVLAVDFPSVITLDYRRQATVFKLGIDYVNLVQQALDAGVFGALGHGMVVHRRPLIFGIS